MNILITGGNFSNKGAELMLVSLVNSISLHFPDADVCVSPLLKGQEKINDLGLKRLSYPLFHYGNSSLFKKLLSSPLLFMTYLKIRGFKWNGEVKLSDIDVVFDISGFAFGDKWGSKPLKDLAFFVEFMNKKGAKVIMMPQAFGPFSSHEMEDAIKNVLSNAKLVFPRDEKSYQYVAELSEGCSAKVELAPDITLTFKKKVEVNNNLFDLPFCAIVPNERMLDKASIGWQKNYKSILERLILKIIEESDLQIIMLIHAQGTSADFKVGEEVYNRIPQSLHNRISMVVEEDPVRLKSIISRANFIIGSRFHALASALSSNVPAIATSWLHKYEMLFKDFKCNEFSFSEPHEAIFDRAEDLLNEDFRQKSINRLVDINMIMEQKSSGMWERIMSELR